MRSRECPVCNKFAELNCSGCKSIGYCGVAHQKAHWEEHKLICKACTVLTALDPSIKPTSVYDLELKRVFSSKTSKLQLSGCLEIEVELRYPNGVLIFKNERINKSALRLSRHSCGYVLPGLLLCLDCLLDKNVKGGRFLMLAENGFLLCNDKWKVELQKQHIDINSSLLVTLQYYSTTSVTSLHIQS